MRDYDLVLFGATGFVGKLTAAYLAKAAPPGARIALAGRSKEKLETVRESLGVDWALVVADTSDAASLAELVASTIAVASTVGPYGKYGPTLVAACVAAGTHYADLTGEVPFVADMAAAHHEAAVASGARIVHACGFDSVPSDLGALLTAQAAQADGATLTDTTLVLLAMKGGVSGGTIDSLRLTIDLMKSDPAVRKLLADPYALSPDRAAEPDLGKQSDAFVLGRDGKRWLGSFVMASYNTRIVRRSNALLDHAWGRGFRYNERMAFGTSPLGPVLAVGAGLGVMGLGAGMAIPPTRKLLDRFLPEPGEGPSEQTQLRGHFTTQTTGVGTNGRAYRTTFSMQGDPGYAATAVMFGEAGLALALDDLPGGGGVLTPAVGIGVGLADRLRAAGATITTVTA